MHRPTVGSYGEAVSYERGTPVLVKEPPFEIGCLSILECKDKSTCRYGPHEEGRCKATCKRGFKLPWREAGPPNHHDDKVDADS